jgi:hypothetical protein
VNEERAVAIRRVRPKADGFLLRLSLAVVLVAAVPGIVLGHNWGGGQDVTKPGRLCKTDAETGYRYSECTAGDSNHHVYISPVSGVPYTLYQALGDSIDQDYDSLAEVTAVQDLSYNTYQTDAVIYGANINSNWGDRVFLLPCWWANGSGQRSLPHVVPSAIHHLPEQSRRKRVLERSSLRGALRLSRARTHPRTAASRRPVHARFLHGVQPSGSDEPTTP